jgi:hypothetical protein
MSSTSRCTASGPLAVATATTRSSRAKWRATAAPIFPDPMIAKVMFVPACRDTARRWFCVPRHRTTGAFRLFPGIPTQRARLTDVDFHGNARHQCGGVSRRAREMTPVGSVSDSCARSWSSVWRLGRLPAVDVQAVGDADRRATVFVSPPCCRPRLAVVNPGLQPV